MSGFEQNPRFEQNPESKSQISIKKSMIFQKKIFGLRGCSTAFQRTYAHQMDPTDLGEHSRTKYYPEITKKTRR